MGICIYRLMGKMVSVRTWYESTHTKRLKRWYLMTPCLTLSIIRYGSRVGGAIQRKE